MTVRAADEAMKDTQSVAGEEDPGAALEAIAPARRDVRGLSERAEAPLSSPSHAQPHLWRKTTMAKSSLLGGAPPDVVPDGRSAASLGPSDSSDSGSDMAGLQADSDSDTAGTGERHGAEPPLRDRAQDNADILPDRVSGAGSDEPPPDASELAQDERDVPGEEGAPDDDTT